MLRLSLDWVWIRAGCILSLDCVKGQFGTRFRVVLDLVFTSFDLGFHLSWFKIGSLSSLDWVSVAITVGVLFPFCYD